MKEKIDTITWIDAVRYREMSDFNRSNVDIMPSFNDMFTYKVNSVSEKSNKGFGLGVLENDKEED